MGSELNNALISVALLRFSAVAQQTNVTSTSPGGTAGAIPYFTGAYTIGNSVFTQSGGNVGIGTTVPGESLDVMGNMVWGMGSERTFDPGCRAFWIYSAAQFARRMPADFTLS